MDRRLRHFAQDSVDPAWIPLHYLRIRLFLRAAGFPTHKSSADKPKAERQQCISRRLRDGIADQQEGCIERSAPDYIGTHSQPIRCDPWIIADPTLKIWHELRTAQDGEQVRPSALGAYRNPKRKAADLRLSFDGLQSMVSDYRRIQSSTGTGDLVFNWTHDQQNLLMR